MAATATHPIPSDAVLVVVVDRAHARFFEVTGSGATEGSALPVPPERGGKYHADRRGGPGWGERDYHGYRREAERRHVDAIAERLEELERRYPGAAVVLAGVDGAGEALRLALPPRLAERVIGTAKLHPRDATLATVRTVAVQVRRAYAPDAERKLVAELVEALGTGRAENGTRAVLRALGKGQIRTLIARPDVRSTGFRCAVSGQLVLSASDCVGQGAPMPVPDVVGAAISEARRQHAAVVVIQDPAAAKAIDGLAALLRFP